MTHDTEAQTATQKIATKFMDSNELCFSDGTAIDQTYASVQIDRRIWPVPDGNITVKTNDNDYRIALEYKRPEEQKHGVLTALGQSISYIERGYDASLIVVPKSYSAKDPRPPEEFIPSVLKYSAPGQPIGVWIYDHALDILECVLPLELDKVTPSVTESISIPGKQWMFVREGEYNPDIVFKYLQTTKRIHDGLEPPQLHPELKKACKRLWPTKNPEKFLSDSPHDNPSDKIWRMFWYTYWFTKDVQTIWEKDDKGNYIVNNAPSEIVHWNSKNMIKFAKAKSIKSKLVKKLNADEITEEKAWEEFAKHVGKDPNSAHSAKETVDSAIYALGFVNEFGKLTLSGYRFVDESELNNNNPYGSIPLKLLRYEMLNTGGYFNFLKNIFDSSKKIFKEDSDAFYENDKFESIKYLQKIEENFTDDLHIMVKAKLREGSTKRKPFQADITILKQFGFIVNQKSPYMRGLGLQINWPFIIESMNAD